MTPDDWARAREIIDGATGHSGGDNVQAAEEIFKPLFAAGFALTLGWQPIKTAPMGDDDFFLVCGVGDERSPFVVRGSILKSARLPNTPSHLHLHYLTHWMPLPEPPNLSPS